MPIELGPIRPPSEAHSLLIRVTRNCPWNRCKFCRTFRGKKFQLRPVEDVKQDILAIKTVVDHIKEIALKDGQSTYLRDAAAKMFHASADDSTRLIAAWVYSGGTSAFLQDANTLIVPVNDLVEILTFMKQNLPTLTRITSYGRSKTAAQRSVEDLIKLKEAGLSRIHIGFESGSDAVLKLMDKGVTAAEQIEGGKKVKASGISLSEYVILGLGGKPLWREHALESARVLSAIDPDYIRLRTLTISEDNEMWGMVERGEFIRETDDEIAVEERLFLENLNCNSNLVSDHVTDLFQEIEGKLPEDKAKFIGTIDRYLALSPDERINFKIGRRACIYNELDDMNDPVRRSHVDAAVARLTAADKLNEETLYELMRGFIV